MDQHRRLVALASAVAAGILVACGGPATDRVAAPDDGATVDPVATWVAEGGALFDAMPPLHPSVDGYGTASLTLRAPDGTTAWRLPVLVADDPVERQHGLMEVERLPFGAGMAFVFDADHLGGFWMKNTLVPLDLAYVDDGVVVSIVTMTPCTADPCPSHPPDAPYDLAVEVTAGTWARLGLGPGWSARLER